MISYQPRPYLLFLFILTIFAELDSQEFNMLDKSSKWYIYSISTADPNNIYEQTDIYKIGSDTLINGLKYKHLLIDNYPSGYCREDSLNRVYYLPPISFLWASCLSPTQYDLEYLLYDFNLKPGDTISYGDDPFFSVVESVDSVLINGYYHKTLQILRFGVYIGDYWIEGIGSLYGFLYPLVCPFEGELYLNCFESNGMLIYQRDINSSCIINDIENTDSKEFEIFPNPCSDVLKITGNEPFKGPVIIKDILGKTMLKTYISGSEVEIDVNSLQSGLYILRIGERIERFIKE